MNRTRISITLAAVLALAACKPAPAGEAAKEAGAAVAEAAIEAPAETPKLAPSEALIDLTCTDFLETAKIATAQPADDAALAAQDEIANGLTWLHGYLFATKAGKIEPLSQEWMAATAERVFNDCNKAEKPSETNLFEVAVS
jgi:hypothetical protein